MTLAVFWLRSRPTISLDYVWGTYVSLLLLTSRLGLGVSRSYPVKPVAAMIQNGTPVGEKVYTSYPYGRPSLNFFSDRQVIPAATSELQHHWQQNPQPISCLINLPENLTLDLVQRVGQAEGWTLITKKN